MTWGGRTMRDVGRWQRFVALMNRFMRGVRRRLGWERGKQVRGEDGKRERRWRPRTESLVTLVTGDNQQGNQLIRADALVTLVTEPVTPLVTRENKRDPGMSPVSPAYDARIRPRAHAIGSTGASDAGDAGDSEREAIQAEANALPVVRYEDLPTEQQMAVRAGAKFTNKQVVGGPGGTRP